MVKYGADGQPSGPVGEPLAGYSTYLVNVSENTRSNPPRKNPAATDRAITTTVSLEVSSRLGHTDFLSSPNVSWRKATGLTLPPGD